MEEPLYNIMFDGAVDPVRDVDEVKANLALLFKKDIAGIENLFSGKSIALKKKIDLATAEKYKNALLKAGAKCSIVAAGPAMAVVTTLETGSTTQFPTLQYPFLSSTYGGINFNRMDMGSVAISDLILLSVFTEAATTGNKEKLLLFVRGFPRPFITDVDRIKFKEFPNVVSLTAPETLKNFIRFLYEQNNALAVDRNTYAFLTGQERITFVRDVSQYINSLGRALEANNKEFLTAVREPALSRNAVSTAAGLLKLAPSVERENEREANQPVLAAESVVSSMPASESAMEASTGQPLTIEKTGGDSAEHYFQEAQELLLDGGSLKEVIAKLEKCIELKPDYWEAHHEIALNFLKPVSQSDSGYSRAEEKIRILFHAQKAVEYAASGQTKIFKTLAEALAVNGSVERGLLTLEDAYGKSRDQKVRKTIENDIEEFRLEHDLGRLWQFFDRRGEMIFESTDIEQIRNKLIDGSLAYYLFCQKNRIGERKSIEALLAPEEPSIEIMISPIMFHVKNGAMIGGAITGGLTALWFVGKFLIYYCKALPGAFSDWIHIGLQNIVAFVAAIILLGLPSLFIALIILGLVIVVIGGVTGLIGAVPGAVAGGIIGFVVSVVRMPFIPKIGPGLKNKSPRQP